MMSDHTDDNARENPKKEIRHVEGARVKKNVREIGCEKIILRTSMMPDHTNESARENPKKDMRHACKKNACRWEDSGNKK